MNIGIASLLSRKLFGFPRLLVILMTAAYAGGAWADGELIGIGTLSNVRIGSLTGLSFVSAMTPDGNVIAGTNGIADGVAHAFRWTVANGMQDLGALPGHGDSFARAISADGNVIVGTTSDLGLGRAFRWTANGRGMQDLGDGTAWAVSADGSVVVGEKGRFRAFRWAANSGMQDLGTLGGKSSSANRISADGRAVVGWSNTADGVVHAFRWTADNGMQDIGILGRHGRVFAISADGNVVVGARYITDAIDHAFRWTPSDGMQDLGTLGGTRSFARAVSADGKVIVGESEVATGSSHAFRWTANSGMQDIGDGSAVAVSADGNAVVGWRGRDINMSTVFRWTTNGGAQSVADWLKSVGARVPADYLTWTVFPVLRVSSDGNTITGTGKNATGIFAWRARISPRASR